MAHAGATTLPWGDMRQSYDGLPERFYAPPELSPVADARLIHLNRPLAAELGLDADWLAGPDGVAMLSASHMPQGVRPLALAYAGHQFGHFVSRLGDGRALLLGDVRDIHGREREIQIKGSGRTAFSRRGDGRAALGPVLREYLLSESMAALGVPTTRALAALRTGETVMREKPLPGGMIVRVAASHIRVGTFQYFAARQDVAGLRLLADFAIARHAPEAAGATHPYVAFLQGVVAAQAGLVAHWMLIGFIHGVMNTDNMAISGETIDYGPCAFMDQYDPATVFSFIDEHGRYAYTNQPSIALWNLTRLAEALLPLLSEDEDQAVEYAQQALAGFHARFHDAYFAGMRAKLGLEGEDTQDETLFHALLETMQATQADFTNTFRALSSGAVIDAATSADWPPAMAEAFAPWLAQWRQRIALHGTATAEERAARMRAVNPCYIPRNHLVEAMITAAIEHDDYAPFEEMLAVLAKPYETQPGRDHFAAPPTPQERVQYTYCGT
ncbi:YdiU family protein [Acetobacter sp. TBRC 12305]|uniref:Protein nucleotidyltransferase YdiU n=1 Tax=Acetobacter garciniae TaxID=2817435 RepID=A0A939HL04_9PROT|nr:YdiU family protein [Acetobacter garciniae]MBO1325442.1 YdiU family protein [Acetobacter garciniae]MBX0345386.1 YdiU family protein [Acetobacter garciniae]